MTNTITARWVGVAGVVMLLCGCTGGPTAGPDPTTGVAPPPASSPPTAPASTSASTPVSTSTAPADDGPVLTIDALPFAKPSDAALPEAQRQALEVTVRDSTRVPGVTSAVPGPTIDTLARRLLAEMRG